jgi:TonB family protein
MSAALAAILLLQAAAPARAPATTTDLPAWSKAPTVAEANAVYPPDAMKANLAGSATVECTVDATGQLADCAVVGESPPGSGFGAAALALSPKFQMPLKSPSGASMVGRTVRFPIRWRNAAKRQLPPVIVNGDTPASGSVVFDCRVKEDHGFDNCVMVDARPPSTNLFAPAGEAALRQKAPANAAPGSRMMVVIQMKGN